MTHTKDEALDLARKALVICEHDVYIPVRLTRDSLTAIKQARSANVQDSDHEFKNFHRLLCERFGYTHDEVDWKRDQISLIEWIAKQVKPAAPVQEPDCVLVPRYLVGAACAAIVGKRDAPKTLEQLRRYTRGDLSTPPAAPVPLTDELSNAVQMACQLSFKDHGRRSVNEQAWQRLMQAVAAYTHGITGKGQP